jgi:hypothetical protein
MYIMLDQSGSMSDIVAGNVEKWKAVTDAISAFVTQPAAAGIGVGIQYFPMPDKASPCSPTCMVEADCGAYGPCIANICFGCIAAASDSCTASDYATPDVGIAEVGANAPAIIASMKSHHPNGSTPTSAALEGAIAYAKTWQSAHPTHVSIVVLATDGDPTECNTDLASIDAIAAGAANGNPKVLTFVIGVGDLKSALDGIAQAGGTNQALIVDTAQDVNQQFLTAMNQIRGAALACEYLIPMPDAGKPDYGKVNVQYTPGDGSGEQILPKVADASQCPPSGDAWYYDNNQSPTKIIMCDHTCARLSIDAKGQVDILTGCATVIN